MSQFLSELLTLLVEDAYGNLCSTIFGVLAQRGRMTLPLIASATNLQTKRVKAAIAVLIQQHLLLWNTVDGVAFYEIDIRTAYNIVRYGKISQMTERRFGGAGKQVIEHIILSGHIKIGTFIAQFEQNLAIQQRRAAKKQRVAGGDVSAAQDANEADEEEDSPHMFDNITSTLHLKQTIRDLLDADYIMPERIQTYKPLSDIHEEAMRAVKEALFPKGPKGTRENKEFNRQVANLKRKWRNGESGIGGIAPTQQKKTKSSKLNAQAVLDLAKPVAAPSAATNGSAPTSTDSIVLNPDTVVRVNEEKVCVLLRNQQLVSLACRHLGPTTSAVYEALLQCLEDQTSRCFESIQIENDDDEAESLPSTTSGAVLRVVNSGLNLYDGLPSEAVPQADTLMDGLYDPGQSEATSRLELVRTHLRILSEDPREFVHWSEGESTEWHVDFSQLSEQLLSTEIDNTITARFSASGARLARVLRDRGRLEEKQLSLFGMLQFKDARIILNTMQEAGYADVQELPKENSRQTARSLWLWSFNDVRCRRLILDETYKTMSRTIQRMKTHRSEYGDVIEKAERALVSRDAAMLMTRAERESLLTWRSIENKLLAQLMRLDDLVGVIRDFFPYTPDAYLMS